tara:strand:- start:2000 stop:2629 length:630 start_codon:yes stop_codon:yes gene_type:complete
MAQISSYPLLVPQLGDSVLGSNIVDSTGSPVLGNPTVQYSFSEVKSLVAQNMTQQLYSASAITIALPQNNTGASIKFSATDVNDPANDNVYYVANTNQFTFRTSGTYYIEQEYNTSSAGGRSPYFAFITKKAGVQVGPTTVNKVWRQVTSDRLMVKISQMIQVVTIPEVYEFWGITGTAAANEDGSLIVNTLTNWTDVPSAAIKISKLV